MARSQNLTTNIVINAKAGSGFAQVGNTLMEMGSIVNQFSQKFFDFAEKSVDVYRNYEKSMKQTEVALATTYGNTTELSSAMEKLDKQATQWAASTIFHTNDVGNAIAEAARAGWDLDQIMTAMPSAMQLAQAGSLDLSTAVDYIVKATNAAGIEFEDLSTFIDEWAYSANSSATTIDEMGSAMIRLGATMGFADSQEEIFTLLASLANVGYVGSEAGTVLRNSMLRLAAPTKKAADAMSTLEMTQDEFEEIMADSELLAATEALEQMGFSAYDTQGNLRPMIEVYKDLNTSLSQMSEQDANQILSAIFPSRTLAAARSLINAAADGYDGLYESLMQGEANGYGQYAATTMMDSLDGSIETFLSKTERLEQVVGGAISDEIRGLLDGLGGFVDSIAETDSDKLGAVVSSMGTVAAMGPGLMVAGGAFKLLSNPMARYALVLAGIVGSLTYLSKMDQARFENNFGDMDLDAGAMAQYITDLGSAYETAYGDVDKFSQALDTAVTSYQTASQTFSSELLTAMLTKQTLTDEDISNLEGLGSQMKDSVINGIWSSADSSAAFWESFFGVEHGQSSDNELFNGIIDTSATWYQGLLGEAEAIGNGITEAMNAAFADGQLSPEERENIMSYVADYNSTLAKAQQEWADMQSQIALEEMMWKSQNASWDSVQETAKEMAEYRDAQLAEYDARYAHERAVQKVVLDQEIANATGLDRQLLINHRDSVLAGMDSQNEQNRAAIDAQFGEFAYNLYDAAIGASDVSEGYSYLSELGASLLNGDISQYSARQQYLKSGYASNDLMNSLVYAISSMGGIDRAIGMYNSYKSGGYTDLADQIGSMIMAYGVAGNYGGWQMSESDLLTGFITGRNYQMTNAFNQNSNPLYFSEQMGTLNTDNAEEQISALDDSSIEIDASADTTEAESQIDSLDGTGITVVVDGNFDPFYNALNVARTAASLITIGGGVAKGYAEGGRATEASIFGEAGAEWAIPEEHTQRTADLLAQAAQASGFTWPELLGLTGGLNANVRNTPTTIVYSPTINAGDARGVESALRRDKENLLKLLAEQKMIGELEAYA